MTKTKPKTEAVVPADPNSPLPVAPVTPIKRYDENFRKSAVEHWIKTGPPGTQIAAELGISYPSLKEWKRRYHGDALPEHGNLQLENRTLRAELARVREQRDILKKRWAASPNRRRALPKHRSHERPT
jgi:transposase-like protein